VNACSRQDDGAARPDAEHPEREVERSGAGRDGERVGHARRVANSRSKRLVFGPVVTSPSAAAITSAISSSPIEGR
jgi:hypothetical protein